MAAREAGANHRNYRAGRFVSGGAAAIEGVRGTRDHPASEYVQYIADRSYLSGPEPAEHAALSASRGPLEHGMDAAADIQPGAGGAVSPGGAEPRASEF